MAIQLQRILESQRSSIVPLQGQLIFATDSKRIYVGDGATLGGIGVGVRYISTSTDSGGLSSVQINNAAGTLIANGTYTNLVFNYDTELQSLSGYADTTNLIGNLLAFDESIIVDSNAKSITVSELNSESLTLEKRSFSSLESPSITLQKFRGTAITPDDIIPGDTLGNIQFLGYADGFAEAGTIQVAARATIQSGRVPGTMRLSVTDGDGASAELLRLDTLNGYIVLQSSQSQAQGLTYKNAQNVVIPGRFVFARSRGSHLVPTSVLTNDRVTDLIFAGHSNGSFRSTAMMTVTVNSAFGNIVRSSINFWTANSSGVLSEVVSIQPSGEVRIDRLSTNSTNTNLTITTQSTSTIVEVSRPMTTSGYLKLPVYANDTERDAAIALPEEGMVVFNRRDDVPGSPQYQGYTTSSGWLSLV